MSSINRYIHIEQLFNQVPRLSKSNRFLHAMGHKVVGVVNSPSKEVHFSVEEFQISGSLVNSIFFAGRFLVVSILQSKQNRTSVAKS